MLHKTMISLLVLSLPGVGFAQNSYLCIKVSMEERMLETQKTLADPFGSSVVDVRAVGQLCSTTTSSSHPDIQQMQYKGSLSRDVQQAKFEKSDHTVFDQFGPHPVTLVKPDGILAASAMSHGGSGTDTADTSGVDDFQCYKAVPSQGAPKFLPPPPIDTQDSFGEKTIAIAKISRICAPASIDGSNPSAPGHAGYLACYRGKLLSGPVTAIVSINNEPFGPGVAYLKSMTEYCVPATLDIPPP